MKRALYEGQLIRVMHPLISGWRGYGRVLRDQRQGSDLVDFEKCPPDPDDNGFSRVCTACRDEVRAVRKLTPALRRKLRIVGTA